MSKTILRLLSMLLAVLAVVPMAAQPSCATRLFNISDGLSANTISGIEQTSDGLMWFSTWNGLCCFDGYQFTTFRDNLDEQQVLTTNRILMLRANILDDIWCITYDRHPHLFSTHECRFIDGTKVLEEHYGIKHFDARSIYSLANGHTWIVSDDGSGVNVRYDDRRIGDPEGVTIVRNMHIRKVVMDELQQEWIFSDEGVQIYGGKFHTPITFEHLQQVGRKIFLATTDGRLSCYADGRLQSLPLPAGITHVGSMVKDGERLLLGTDKGVVSYDTRRNSAAILTATDGEVSHLFVDSRHRIWFFTTAEGISLLQTDGTVTQLSAPAVMPEQATTSKLPFIIEDRYGTVWLIPTGGTFCYYDEAWKTLVPYLLQPAGGKRVVMPRINKWFSDQLGNLWFSGQHDLSLASFRHHRSQIEMLRPNEEVRAVFRNNDGRLWVGDDQGHIMIYTRESVREGYVNSQGQLQSSECTVEGKIFDFHRDRQGDMWVATKGAGIYRFGATGAHHYTHNDADPASLSHNDVYDIFEDGAGHMWVATYEQGINLVQTAADGSVKFVHRNNGLKNYPASAGKVRRLTRTKDGVIIVSTSNGLLTFSERFDRPADVRFFESTHQWRDTTSLLSNDVMQTCVTRSGQIYVATLGGGIQRITSSNLLQDSLRFSTVQGLTNAGGSFQSIVEDNDGRLWLIRENQLNAYTPATGEREVFSLNEQNEQIEFSEAQPALDPQTGSISLGLVGGFITFNPKDIQKSTFVPKIAFINVQFQGEMGTHPILNSELLDVPADKRSLTITFAALDYGGNELTRYAYKLEGVDDDWNYTDRSHSASFNDLPPGHLRLLVRSTNADGVWVDNTRVLNIYSHPTFWESPWGWMLYIVLFIGLLVIILYIYNLRSRNRLEKKMNDMKTSFFTNIGHRLRTPLTLIGGPVTEILQRGDIDEDDRQSLEMVQRNSRNMLQLVNDMLDYDNTKKDNIFVDDSNAPVFATQETEETDDNDKEKDVTLLVVEDNDDLRQFLVSILSHDYRVLTAANGQQGLQLATDMQPDFIITDVMMPVMDGLTMVHQIKQDKSVSHIPIIVLSAKASLQDKLQGLQEGIDDYITKPFSATYLKQRVENIISQRRVLQQSYLEQMAVATDQTGQKPEFHLNAPEIVDTDKRMMDALMAYLEENIGNSDLRIEDLARTVGLSRTIFYGKIKAIVGMTPVDFLRHIRMQRAEQLIVGSHDTFSQIAYAVGFTDPKYFTKCFKKETGMTPSEYRESRQH